MSTGAAGRCGRAAVRSCGGAVLRRCGGGSCGREAVRSCGREAVRSCGNPRHIIARNRPAVSRVLGPRDGSTQHRASRPSCVECSRPSFPGLTADPVPERSFPGRGRPGLTTHLGDMHRRVRAFRHTRGYGGDRDPERGIPVHGSARPDVLTLCPPPRPTRDASRTSSALGVTDCRAKRSPTTSARACSTP